MADSVTLTGFEKIHAKLKAIEQIPTSDQKTEMAKLGTLGVQQNFAPVNYMGWPPLAPATIAKRRRMGIRHTNILVERKQRLPKNVKYRFVAGGFELYSREFFGRFHHEGKGGMPKRPWMTLRDEWKAKLMDVLKRAIRK